MPAIQFYHLTTTPLERALPKLLEKALAGGFKTLLVDESEARLEQLNQLLWTYDPGSFLPHGGLKDGHPEEQPVLLCHPAFIAGSGENSWRSRNKCGMTVLCLTSGTVPENPDDFDRILDIFDGNDPEAVANARTRWKTYKDAGHALTYLKQTESGGWEKRD